MINLPAKETAFGQKHLSVKAHMILTNHKQFHKQFQTTNGFKEIGNEKQTYVGETCAAADEQTLE